MQGTQLVFDILIGPEVGNSERARVPRFNRFQRRAPRPQIDVRRWRGGKHAATLDAHSRDVARERTPAWRVQVGDMVGSVAWRVGNLEVAKGLAAEQHAHVLSRHWQHLAPQALHVRAVQTRGTPQQPGRIDHVRSAPLVHPYLDVGKAPQQRAGGPGVVQVYVRQRYYPRWVALEHPEQLLQAAARTWVDDHITDPPCADHLRSAEVQQVDELRVGGGFRHGGGHLCLPAYKRDQPVANPGAAAPRALRFVSHSQHA